MSRPIKFRGKQIDNGEWVYGNLIRMNNEVGCGEPPVFSNCWIMEIKDELEIRSFADDCTVWTDNELIQVDPETVGQYTGDNDRGYEGDILEWIEPIRSEHGDIEDYEHCRGVVEWDNERSGFIVRCANGNEWLDDLMNITVIGNIYEHPHLLKGEDTNANIK
ncbi:YopX family protein [Paenibacillus taiwanensis]|uniref:YopX family protein n=1 Tax=Paenibacillus taiwanensis TaxID=401638 RepID=UPI0003F5BB71|nr:YopX family protein [Paenibacillus taiwanensis]